MFRLILSGQAKSSVGLMKIKNGGGLHSGMMGY